MKTFALHASTLAVFAIVAAHATPALADVDLHSVSTTVAFKLKYTLPSGEARNDVLPKAQNTTGSLTLRTTAAQPQQEVTILDEQDVQIVLCEASGTRWCFVPWKKSDARYNDELPADAASVTRTSSSCSNVSPMPSYAPEAKAASRTSFDR
jgi:hypothetical protein